MILFIICYGYCISSEQPLISLFFLFTQWELMVGGVMEIVAPENTTLTNNARHVLEIVQVQQDIQVLTACLKKNRAFCS